MDAASSGGSSLSDSAQGKKPQPSASDPTRVSVPLRNPAPKASGKSWTPPAGYAPKKSGATSSSTLRPADAAEMFQRFDSLLQQAETKSSTSREMNAAQMFERFDSFLKQSEATNLSRDTDAADMFQRVDSFMKQSEATSSRLRPADAAVMFQRVDSFLQQSEATSKPRDPNAAEMFRRFDSFRNQVENANNMFKTFDAFRKEAASNSERTSKPSNPTSKESLTPSVPKSTTPEQLKKPEVEAPASSQAPKASGKSW